MIEAAEWRQNYIAPDGGGKLETTDEREPFLVDAPRITKNENSQLFLVMGHIALHKLGLLTEWDKETFNRHIGLSRARYGVFLRRTNDFGIRQSHDNIIGICVGAMIHNTDHAKEICEHGESTGFNYSFRGWEIESQLQGGDIALIKAMAGRVPALWEIAWAMGGLLTKKDDGQVNLLSVRVYGLNLVETTHPIVQAFKAFYTLIYVLKYKKRMVQSVRNYFHRDPPNPFVKLWEEAFK